MGRIKIIAFIRTYEGKNNTDDLNEYEKYDEIEFSRNISDYLIPLIKEWEEIEGMDHYDVIELKGGYQKNYEQYDRGQLHLLFNY